MHRLRMRQGGLPAGTLRDIASAVAMLVSRKPRKRGAGADALARIAWLGIHNDRKLVEFQEAVAARADGIPLILRALGAADAAAAEYTAHVSVLLVCSSENEAAITAAGGSL